MTEQQPLSIDLATDEGKQELSRVAGEVLTNPTGCENCLFVQEPAKGALSCKSAISVSNPCGWVAEDHLCLDAKGGPIPLTWQEAMKWRDWAVEKFGADTFITWLLRTCKGRGVPWTQELALAQPEHYILAAVLCEIRSKK